MAGFNDFLNIFFGSTQSQVTAYAILAAIVAICITVLLTKTDMGIGDKFLLIFFVILTLVPGVFLILFEITCMVTGGSKDKRWWCWLYAWVIAAFVVIYCILVVIISFSSLFTYNSAIENVELNEAKNKMSPQDSNDYAKALIQSNEYKEQFQNNDLQSTLNALIKSADDQTKDKENFYGSTELIEGIPSEKEIVEKINKSKEEEKKKIISNFIGGSVIDILPPLKKEEHDSFYGGSVDLKKDKKMDSFYGGNQLYEGFATQKKVEEKELDDEDEESVKAKVETKEEDHEEKKKEEKSKFTNKKDTSSKSKSISLDDEETDETTPEAVVEPFGNMNFGVRYSRY